MNEMVVQQVEYEAQYSWSEKHFSVCSKFLHCTIILRNVCEVVVLEENHIIIFYRPRKKCSFVWFPCPICIEYHMIITSLHRYRMGNRAKSRHFRARLEFLFLLKKKIIYANTECDGREGWWSCQRWMDRPLSVQHHFPLCRYLQQWTTMHSFPSVVLSRLTVFSSFTLKWFMNSRTIAGKMNFSGFLCICAQFIRDNFYFKPIKPESLFSCTAKPNAWRLYCNQ